MTPTISRPDTERCKAMAERLRHSENEWADAATNGQQWLQNIADGISTPAEALENMNSNIAHCIKVRDEAGRWSDLLDRLSAQGRDVPPTPTDDVKAMEKLLVWLRKADHDEIVFTLEGRKTVIRPDYILIEHLELLERLTAQAQPSAGPAVREALEIVIRAADFPPHKRTDAEFLRASCINAKAYAEVALKALATPDPRGPSVEDVRRQTIEECAEAARSYLKSKGYSGEKTHAAILALSPTQAGGETNTPETSSGSAGAVRSNKEER